MPWGKLDDSLYDHPKVERLPDGIRLACVGLWALSCSYSNRHLTDGHVPASTIRRLGGSKRLVDALIAVELYELAADGVVVHDFLDHNKSRIQVLEERDKRAESGRLGGLARGRQLGKHPPSKLLSKTEAPGAEPPSRPVLDSPQPPPSGGSPRAMGTSPRQLAARAEEARLAEAEDRRELVGQIRQRYYRGEITETQLNAELADVGKAADDLTRARA